METQVRVVVGVHEVEARAQERQALTRRTASKTGRETDDRVVAIRQVRIDWL